MSKRTATTELNRDNCELEDPPEEAGFFKQAPEEVLKQRVIRTARRRCAQGTQDGEGVKNVFAGFSGFGQSSQASAAKPSFSFLSSTKPSGNNGTDDKSKDSNTTPVNGLVTETTSKQAKGIIMLSCVESKLGFYC